MHTHLILLADLSYQIGLIGLAEYAERMNIAHWLSPDAESSPDPRFNSERQDKEVASIEALPPDQEGATPVDGVAHTRPRKPFLEFLALNKWMFTKGDRDCYPSVPHGHLRSKTREWPKLNPYTGCVFQQVHLEDPNSRLTRAEMLQIWSDDKFIEHCRQQVLWYSDFSPNYAFPNARRGRLVFPTWT